jgi:hypothetical protein
MSNAGGFKSLTRYYDMLAGNTVWNPWSPAGAFDALATFTVGATSVASISFTGIPTTYKHLQLRLTAKSDRSTSPLSSIGLQFNGDTSSNYRTHNIYGTGSAAGASTSANTITFDRISGNTGATNIFGSMIIDFLDYQNSSTNKTVRCLGGVDFNGSGEIDFQSGLWFPTTTAGINRIDILPSYQSTVFLQYSTFSLYGIK